MDLPDHPPAEWQIALPKVQSLTCMQRHMPAVCLPKLNITFLISPIDAQIPKWMHVSHTQTHTCCGVLLRLLRHRTLCSWSETLRFAPLSRGTAVRARFPRVWLKPLLKPSGRWTDSRPAQHCKHLKYLIQACRDSGWLKFKNDSTSRKWGRTKLRSSRLRWLFSWVLCNIQDRKQSRYFLSVKK